MMLDLSIIIVNYNTFFLTCQCIEGIYTKTVDINYEVILVDNGSTELDPNAFLEKFPEVKLVKSETNLGFSKGNNLGIAHARGRYVLLLNSDTTFINDAASIMVRYLEGRPDVAVGGGALLYPDGVYQHCCQRFPSVKYKLFELFRIQKFMSRRRAGKILLGSFFDHEVEIESDWVWGTFFMFKRNYLSLLPDSKLDDRFFMYCEDMEWCFSFRKLGKKIYYNPEAKVVHHMGMSKGPKSLMMKANHESFMNAHYNWLHRSTIQLLDLLLVFSLSKWKSV
jgi:GT2 family glycosyltransferase